MIVRLLTSAALLPLALCALAQDVKYEKYTLMNGMTVILHEDHTLPVATVNTWYHVGSKDEMARRTGFAHLFEHLMFMGTERVPTGMFDKIMEAGGGNNNASTSADRTNYYDFGPSSQLPTLLWLEADRLEDFGRAMNQKKLDLQREVVKNERRENFENAPYGKVPLAMYAAMYPEAHPYHLATIGLPEDLDAATVKDVQDFFASYYVPNNATMVVAGDFDPKAIKPLIAKLFGTLPRADDPTHKVAPEPALHEIKRMTLTDKVPLARTHMVWHSPAWYKPGDGEMDLFANLLSTGFSSRLYQRLVVKDQLASDVAAYQQSQYLGSLFVIQATAKEGVSLDKLEATIDDEVGKLLKTGPGVDELSRVKARWQFDAVNGLQSLADIADRLNQYDFYLGKPNSFRWDLDRHLKATPLGIQTWGLKVLDPKARLILRVIPQQEKPAVNPRDQQPAPLAEKDFMLPTPTELKLANGIKLIYFHRPELPLMNLSIQFSAGAAGDPAEKSGLASMTAAMLDQGAGDLDADAFNKALDALGAQFSASAGRLTSSVDLEVTSGNFEKALPLVADSIIRYRLDPKAWEREKGLRLDELAQAADDPDTIAQEVALREFFGAGHAYGRNPSGRQATVKNITLDDVRSEHQAIYQPKLATFFGAGSLPVAQVKALLDKQFAQWQPSGGPLATPPMTPPANQGLRVVIVDRPDAAQTVIRFVFPGVPYSDPNRLALSGLSTILGGTFTSRLNANLREDKGFTYGAGTRLASDPAVGYLTAVSPVRADVTGASLKEFLSEFKKIRTGDIQEAEALKARTSLRTDVITSAGSLGGLVGLAELLFLNGQSFAEYTAEARKLASLSAAQMNPLANNAIQLERAVLVLVGDKTQILKQIEGLGLAKPEIVSGLD